MSWTSYMHYYSRICCAALCLWTLAAFGADFYVAPDGEDTQPGTLDKPFATLDRALAAGRAVQDEPVTIYLRGGTYRLVSPLHLSAEDGGTKSAPHVIRPWRAERVVLSGGRVINGWQVGEDGIWRTTIEPVKRGEKFNELFVDGVRATRARHPNANFLRVEKVGEDKRTSFNYARGDLPKLKLTEDTELVFLHDWSISRVHIAAIDPNTRTLQTAYNVGGAAKQFELDHFDSHPRYFLENNPAFLDAPGEWYLDTTTGVLSYKPLPGQKPDKVEVVAPFLTKLLEIKGQPDRPVGYLRLENLRFEHCAFDYGERYAGGQAGFHEKVKSKGPVPAAITIDYGQNMKLSDIQISHVGGTGIWINNRSQAIDVSRMHIEDTGGNGLMIGEQGFTKVGEGFAPVTTQVHISNSVFEKVGQRFFGAVGVWIGISNYITFEHNLVRFMPYTGVSVGWRWNDDPTPIHDIVIANNHIHHNMQILSDGGGIYTLGRMPKSKIIGNLIHDIPLNAGRAESNGIFFDAGTSDLLIEDNIIFNTARAPLRFHAVRNNISRANLLVRPSDQPAYRYNGDVERYIIKDNDRTTADQLDITTVQRRAEAVGPR